MNSHYNHCILEEDVPNVYMSNYSAAEFNQQVHRGHITPHQMHFGLAYNMQLQDLGPIAQQGNQNADVDNHNDAMFDDEDDASLPPPLVRDGEYDDIQSSDDEEDEEDDTGNELAIVIPIVIHFFGLLSRYYRARVTIGLLSVRRIYIGISTILLSDYYREYVTQVKKWIAIGLQ